VPGTAIQLMSRGLGTGVIPWSMLSSLSFRSRPSYASARSAPARRLEVSLGWQPAKVPKVSALAPVKRRKTQREFPLDRKFREFVPGKEIRGCRVDLDNRGDFAQPPGGTRPTTPHIFSWFARLYVGEGKAMRRAAIEVPEAIQEALGFCSTAANTTRLLAFAKDLDESLREKLPDATSLQGAWTNRHKGCIGPYRVVEVLSIGARL